MMKTLKSLKVLIAERDNLLILMVELSQISQIP